MIHSSSIQKASFVKSLAGRAWLPLVALVALGGLALATGAGARLPAPAPAPSTFQVDKVHSSLIFQVKYAGVSSFYGRFDDFSGSFSVDPENPSTASFDLVVEAASVNSANEKRDAHLTSPDFFSAKQFPKIRFVSKKVTPSKADAKILDVEGELTFRGVTKPVKATVLFGGTVKGRNGGLLAGFDGTLMIKRSDFGVTYGQDMLGDEVTIKMGLAGLKS